MFGMYRKDERTDHEIYMEEQLERAREESRREDERREEQRRQRQEEFSEARRYEERHPDSWPQAFRNQSNLCWREHNSWPGDIPEVDDNYFKNTAEANEKALQLWETISDSKQAELDALQKQIDAVWDAIRNEVADALEQADARNEYKLVASAIRDDELEGYCDW